MRPGSPPSAPERETAERSTAPPKTDIVLLSTADWDNPFWTNKQHVAVELARRGHRVLYIDSLGLRRPSASSQDFGRILKRLLRALRPPRRVRERVWVWSPLVIPLQHLALARKLNGWSLRAGLWLWSRWLKLSRDLLWTYNPMTTRLFPTRDFGTVVYHCVDEIEAQRGMPAREIGEAEHELLAAASYCFVTAEHLLETRRSLCSSIHYFPNVADFDHFSKARAAETLVPKDLADLPRPRIGFVGAISDQKIDVALVRRLAELHPEWSIVLIGKVGEGDPWTNIEPLRGLPNLHLLGPRPYELLPSYLKGFDVAMLPAAMNSYTRGMFPMKFFEYLAAGCPVVSTALPALRAFGDVACLAETPEHFVAGCARALRGYTPPLATRLAVAREHTYERRTARMMQLLEAQ
jgi:glycosyltransferase involved in cell wall biosynthesis